MVSILDAGIFDHQVYAHTGSLVGATGVVGALGLPPSSKVLVNKATVVRFNVL